MAQRPKRKRSRRKATQAEFARRNKRIAIVTVFGIAALSAWFAVELVRWPDVDRVRTEFPTSTAFIERHVALEKSRGRSGSIAWQLTPLTHIADNLKLAVIVSEDAGFFAHDGFAPTEMKSAVKEALTSGKPLRGASTITQQLAKNLWLSPSRNPARKIKEALLTRQLEDKMSKRRLLELYLNVVEFGPGVFGAASASHIYFKKSARDLTPSEAAQLAAGLPNPKRWHPGSNSATYRHRVDKIQNRMAATEHLLRNLDPER